MITAYTILTSAGQVVGFGTVQTEVLEQVTIPDGCHLLPVEAKFREGGYYDFAANEFYEKAQPPTPHHVFNYTTKQWEDPRTLQDLKDAKWATIKQARSAAEYAGFTWDGSVFDSDAISQQRISGAVTLAQMSPDFVIDWTLADNRVRTLVRAEMVAVGIALGMHVQAQFSKAQGLRLQIDAASTPGQVAVVVW
jgi:hypothetical protein